MSNHLQIAEKLARHFTDEMDTKSLELFYFESAVEALLTYDSADLIAEYYEIFQEYPPA